MGKIDGAVSWAIAIANNPAHGYDQLHRWGPDYDCSSLVISAWESVGLAVREAGASYTGNMRGAFLSCGFRAVTGSVDLATGIGLEPGDVLLNYGAHTAMVTGNGRMVAARINEHGQTTGGAEGDQTGREICQQNYYNYPWDAVLRYQERGTTAADHSAGSGNKVPAHPETTIRGIPLVKRGSRGELVRAAQYLLEGRGFSCGIHGADGDFGSATEKAVKAFQDDRDLLQDGQIGDNTWTRLLLG